MIKVGIYGSGNVADPVRKQLLRLLLRHPDVELRAVASPAGNAVPLAELHPVYAGETDLTLNRVLDIDNLDVLFVIDAENLSEAMLEKLESDKNFRLIVLGAADGLLEQALHGGERAPVYGLPEYFRKALVRGARYAVSPSPAAMALILSVLPLAKNGLLDGELSIEAGGLPQGVCAERYCAEALAMLAQVCPGMSCSAKAVEAPSPAYERIDMKVSLNIPLAVEELNRIYRDAYDDHSFVHVIPGKGPVDEDLRGSNKCLLRFDRVGERLDIYSSMDGMTKGITGNAVHIMNLLFGLLERTGLSI